MNTEEEYYPITERDLPIGQPVRWPVFDPFGRELLKKGDVISSKRQVDSLIARGAYRKQADIQKVRKITSEQKGIKERGILHSSTPFEIIHDVVQRITKLYELLEQEFPPNVHDRTKLIAEDLIDMYEHQPDAMLAAVHLVHEYDYTICHPLHISILVIMMAIDMEIEHDNLASIVCAAITQNVSMNELQKELQNQSGGLTDAQKQAIQSHPELSVEKLRHAGVDDEDWLDIVLQHHERVDGKGYPRGMKGDEIRIGAKLISLADTYSAMVSSRAYRDPMAPNHVLKELFLSKGKEFDEVLSLRFIKDIGVYPPGACVKLNNGESGIIIARQKNVLQPLVSAYVSPRGGPYPRPFKRDTSQEHFHIQSITVPDPGIPMNLTKIFFF